MKRSKRCEGGKGGKGGIWGEEEGMHTSVWEGAKNVFDDVHVAMLACEMECRGPRGCLHPHVHTLHVRARQEGVVEAKPILHQREDKRWKIEGERRGGEEKRRRGDRK